MTEPDKNKQRRFVQLTVLLARAVTDMHLKREKLADNVACVANCESFVNPRFRRIPDIHFRFHTTGSDRTCWAIDIQCPICCSYQPQKPHQTKLQEYLGPYVGIHQVIHTRHTTRYKPPVAQFCRDCHNGSGSARRAPAMAGCAR